MVKWSEEIPSVHIGVPGATATANHPTNKHRGIAYTIGLPQGGGMARATRNVATAGVPGQRVGELRSGDHILLVYEDTPELTAFLLSYFRNGLAQGQRCVYVFGELEPREVIDALAAGGVDVQREVERGALVVSSAQEYFRLPPFDPLRMLDVFRKRAAEATPRGFTGLRIAGEMTWTLQHRVGDDALVELESLLEEAVGPDRLTVACLYRRDRFPPAALQRLIRSHAKVVTSDSVFLNLSALFQNLARSDLQSLLQSAGERHKRKREFYFHQGDRATEVFVLKSGKVKLVRTEPDGRSVILRIIAPTDPFGDRAALLESTRLASAQALEDSRALVWDAATIRQVITTHPAVSLNALRLLEERVEEERSRLEDLATSNVERRLARLLLRLAQSVGRKTRHGIAIEVPLTGNDLAELAIATPYTVSRILAGWKRRRITDVRRQRILILDQERMAAFAGAPARVPAAISLEQSTRSPQPSAAASRPTRPQQRR